MSQGAVDVEKLRADYRTVARGLMQSDGWSAEEVDEMGAAIKRAIEAGEAEILVCWANWLASLAAQFRDFAAGVRAMEARMRAGTGENKTK